MSTTISHGDVSQRPRKTQDIVPDVTPTTLKRSMSVLVPSLYNVHQPEHAQSRIKKRRLNEPERHLKRGRSTTAESFHHDQQYGDYGAISRFKKRRQHEPIAKRQLKRARSSELDTVSTSRKHHKSHSGSPSMSPSAPTTVFPRRSLIDIELSDEGLTESIMKYYILSQPNSRVSQIRFNLHTINMILTDGLNAVKWECAVRHHRHMDELTETFDTVLKTNFTDTSTNDSKRTIPFSFDAVYSYPEEDTKIVTEYIDGLHTPQRTGNTVGWSLSETRSILYNFIQAERLRCLSAINVYQTQYYDNLASQYTNILTAHLGMNDQNTEYT